MHYLIYLSIIFKNKLTNQNVLVQKMKMSEKYRDNNRNKNNSNSDGPLTSRRTKGGKNEAGNHVIYHMYMLALLHRPVNPSAF